MADHLSRLRAAVDAWNAHDRDRYVASYAPDAALHGFPPPITGPDSLADFFVGMWAAVPDARIVLEDTLQDGDRVAGRFTVAGTHEGVLMGVPASHRTFTFGVMGIFRFDDEGRIAERWNAADFLSMLQQIGAVPAPAPA
jgi:steroid delta-isomerase-like uncharacterized protein